jgi:anthranilate phosphoribosyltransferase
MDAPATWSALMGTLVRGEALTRDDTAWAMGEIMEGAATPPRSPGSAWRCG